MLAKIGGSPSNYTPNMYLTPPPPDLLTSKKKKQRATKNLPTPPKYIWLFLGQMQSSMVYKQKWSRNVRHGKPRFGGQSGNCTPVTSASRRDPNKSLGMALSGKGNIRTKSPLESNSCRAPLQLGYCWYILGVGMFRIEA